LCVLIIVTAAIMWPLLAAPMTDVAVRL
jgi:hypothetical protein